MASFPFAPLGFLLIAVSLCLHAAAGALCDVSTPSSPTAPGRFFYRGGGFHMHLVMDAEPWMDAIQSNFTVESGLFVDLEELRNHFTMELVQPDPPTGGSVGQPPAARVTDVTDMFTLTSLESEEDFDIEAPVFKVSYKSAAVTVAFVNHMPPSVKTEALQTNGRLRVVLPIHARYPEAYKSRDADTYENLLRQGPTVALDALLNADPQATAEACLTNLKLGWRSDSCGGGTDVSWEDRRLCTPVPAGELALLPFAYTALMGLLWLGAMIVFGCLCVPPLRP